MRIQLQRNFYLDEFQCRCGCGGAYTLDGELILKLQALRDDVAVLEGEEIGFIVTSGTRCKQHHRKIYEAKGQPVKWGSRHLRGKAADLKLIRRSNRAGLLWSDGLIELARKYFNGIGIPKSRVYLHVDVRESRAEWDYPGE